MSLIKSKKRVTDHREVFTSGGKVNAMPDLMEHQTQRINSRFPEPALVGMEIPGLCFLVRKLAVAERQCIKIKASRTSGPNQKRLAATAICCRRILVSIVTRTFLSGNNVPHCIGRFSVTALTTNKLYEFAANGNIGRGNKSPADFAFAVCNRLHHVIIPPFGNGIMVFFRHPKAAMWVCFHVRILCARLLA